MFSNWREKRGGDDEREKKELIKRATEFLQKDRYNHYQTDKNQTPRDHRGFCQLVSPNNDYKAVHVGQSDVVQEDMYNSHLEGDIANQTNYVVGYFVFCSSFKQHIKGNVPMKQAIKWLEEEKLIFPHSEYGREKHKMFDNRKNPFTKESKYVCLIVPSNYEKTENE